MSAILQISEFLPNPVGSDAAGEWVEIHNTTDQTVLLGGWRLVNESGKSASLNGSIGPSEFKVLNRSQTKLALKNKDGSLELIDPRNQIVDRAGFFGEAPEGKSFSRSGDVFIPTKPTPGKINELPLKTHDGYVLNKPVLITKGEGLILEPIVTGLVLALLFCWVSWFTIRKSHDLSHLFFG